MGRPFDKHIDNQELNALVPWPSETGQEAYGLSPEAVLEAGRHVESCEDCSRKVAKCRQLVERFSNVVVSRAVPPGADCPRDVDWYEVAIGLWPELKARQLLVHAGTCDHCGPLLRTAASVNQEATPQEEKLLAELKAPSRPEPIPQPVTPSSPRWPFVRWLVPALALILIVGVLVTWPSSRPLSGAKYAEFAVTTHRQHAQGNLALDVRLDSQQMLRFKAKLPFSLALPASPAVPGWPAGGDRWSSDSPAK